MIISKKKYEKAIHEAVDQKMREYDEKRWLDDRIRSIEMNFDRRMDSMYERIRKIEEVVFPNEPEKCCDDHVNMKCGY